jgi:hypothetical protein
MSKYFEEIEFEDPKPEVPKPVDPVFNPERLAVALEEVDNEIMKLESGTSSNLRRAINFGPYGCPAQNSLKTFKLEPTWKNFKMFIQLAEQDFSRRPAKALKEMLLKAVEK